MADNDATGPVPPYASFATILHQIERMEKEGVPNRIDNSYLIGMSGGTQSQVKHALRSMDLIADDGATTLRLNDLAKRPDNRPELVADLLRDRYPSLTGLGLGATRGELDEEIKKFDLNGATARKAASFYVAAASYAGIPLSPHVKPRSGPGASNGTSARRSGTRRRAQQPPRGTQDDSQTAKQDMQRVYFELLVSKMEKSDNLDSDILDRIERLVGMAPTGEQDTTEAKESP